MQLLSESEIKFVSGGFQNVEGNNKTARTSASPGPSLSRPTPGESERGREVNDLAAALDALGSWIGIGLYDLFHPAPSNKK
jgi:hypothetical protein